MIARRSLRLSDRRGVLAFNGGLAAFRRALGMSRFDQTSNAEQARNEAADWFARLQSDETGGEDWIAFETWLAEDSAHQTAFEDVERLWLFLDEAVKSKAVVPSNVRTLGDARRRKTWPIWAAPAAAAAVAAVAAGVVVLLKPPPAPPPSNPGQVIATLKGERRTVTLTDGSRIDLDAASRLIVYARDQGRRVRLVEGQAAFTVVHDPSRPFSVIAGDQTIRDVGTTFDVSRYDQTLSVTVQSGEVSVAEKGVPVAQLGAGEQLLQRPGAAPLVTRTVDADAALAWRSGTLIYRNQPLRTVAVDLNRYFSGAIRIEGDRTAELRFSGVLTLDSEDAVVRRLQAFLPIVATRKGEDFILRGRPSSR